MWQLLLFARGNLFNALKHATGAPRDRICSIRPGSRALLCFLISQSKVKPALFYAPKSLNVGLLPQNSTILFLPRKPQIRHTLYKYAYINIFDFTCPNGLKKIVLCYMLEGVVVRQDAFTFLNLLQENS